MTIGHHHYRAAAKQGLTVPEAARALGVTTTAVRMAAARLGIQFQRVRPAPARPPHQYPDAAEELARAVADMTEPTDLIQWLYVRAAVHACGGNVSDAARRMGMHRRTVQRILQSHRPKGRV